MIACHLPVRLVLGPSHPWRTTWGRGGEGKGERKGVVVTRPLVQLSFFAKIYNGSVKISHPTAMFNPSIADTCSIAGKLAQYPPD